MKKVHFTVWLGQEQEPPHRRITRMMDVKNVHKAEKSKGQAVWSGTITIGNREMVVVAYADAEPFEFSAIFQVDEANFSVHQLRIMLADLERYRKYRINPPETFFDDLVELTLKVEAYHDAKANKTVLVESE